MIAAVSKPWVKKPANSPLSVHKRGWCKKINGKVVVVAGKIPHRDALDIYYRRMSELHAEPAPVVEEVQSEPIQPAPETVIVSSVTVEEIKDKYLAHKTRAYSLDEYGARTLMNLRELLPRFAKEYPGAIAALTPEDFGNYRAALSGKYSPTTVNRHVTNVRAMFSWAYRNNIIPTMPRWGDAFEKPPAKELRKYRQKLKLENGKKLFSGPQIKKLMLMADDSLHAMILLGINCGLGNSDVGRLTLHHLDLDAGILDYPRPKTGEERRSILWPETIAAIKKVVAKRPVPRDPKDKDHIFLTQTGLTWVREDATIGETGSKVGTKVDYVALKFGELIRRAELSRTGLGFYALRHTFMTIAGQTTDNFAVMRVMGHTLPGMAATYVQEIGDDRLRHVVMYVRKQILG